MYTFINNTTHDKCDLCPFCVFTPFPTCAIEKEFDIEKLKNYKYHCEVVLEKIEEDEKLNQRSNNAPS